MQYRDTVEIWLHEELIKQNAKTGIETGLATIQKIKLRRFKLPNFYECRQAARAAEP